MTEDDLIDSLAQGPNWIWYHRRALYHLLKRNFPDSLRALGQFVDSGFDVEACLPNGYGFPGYPGPSSASRRRRGTPAEPRPKNHALSRVRPSRQDMEALCRDLLAALNLSVHRSSPDASSTSPSPPRRTNMTSR